MSSTRPGTADVLACRDRDQIAVIYADVLGALEGREVDRDTRIRILMGLYRDSETCRLDTFVSRERALATVARMRSEVVA